MAILHNVVTKNTVTLREHCLSVMKKLRGKRVHKNHFFEAMKDSDWGESVTDWDFEINSQRTS